MNLQQDPNNPDIQLHGQYHGYTVTRIAEIAETGSFFYELEHRATGARHIHISNQDRENTFGVAFKTVPKDSTGVAHILEHTVLCGSDKFPVRDPFFSMLKRSLSTFMNAFTASDWTMYPFSTQNRKDFYNLMDVYLDAVFFPKIEELSFKQEGHRLEIDGPVEDKVGSRLVYKGVVYNEMKGAMSSPDQVMARSLLKTLYPATTYRHNSGGDPAVIPSLSYEQLKNFHRNHYHPSNAFFYTYGNLPLLEHLAFVEDKVLKNYQRITPDTHVPSQPRWKKPGRATGSYPLAETEDPTKKYQVCVAWLMADIRDTLEILVLALLEHILLGNPASPLRQALIDSRLGTALCDSAGYDADNRDTMFVCGLKDVQENAAEKIAAIIFDVLGGLVEKGIDRDLIESAIHQIEFHRREVTNSPYPYGIKQLLIIAGTWLHGGDPLKKMKLDEDLTKLREALAREPFFENSIKKYFLDNPHRILFVLNPDQGMEKRERDRVAAELDRNKTALGKAEKDKIIAEARALKILQETQEDVSRLPTLKRDDIPADIQKVQAVAALDDIASSCYDQKTSGIFYLAAAAGVGLLDRELIPLVPFFCYAFPKTGTAVRDYTDLARQIDLYTGGISLSSHARTGFDGSGSCIPFISFNGKCLNRNQDRMLDLIKELILEPDYSDLSRLKSLLLEYRASMESMVVNNGHRFAISLAARNFSLTRYLSESWSGIHQLQTIKTITDHISEDRLHSVSVKMASIHKQMFLKNNIKTALIGGEKALAAAQPAVKTIYSNLEEDVGIKSSHDEFEPPQIEVNDDMPREGWSTSTAVSFVAQAFKTVRMEHEDAPALSIISKILRSNYLHREIREKGGAYGGFALYNPEDGLFCFASYRDPHIVSTMQVYKKAADFIRSGSYSEEDVDEALLQVCSEIDKPDPPGPAARKAFYRKIISLSDDARLNFKTRLLGLTRRRILEAADNYFADPQEKNAVAVISGEAQLKAANEKLDPPLSLYRI
jgi:Zn-dependent M16 (insulinase) family peptidase